MRARAAGLVANALALTLLVVIALGRTAHADGACHVDRARQELRLARLAESGTSQHRTKARDALDASPPGCRDAAWYLVAAQILREPGVTPLADGTATLSTPKDALAAGLRRDARSPELLAMVAFLSRLDARLAPPLPTDACARISASADAPLRDYVCAHAALRARHDADAIDPFARADAALDARKERRFIDAGVRRAEALAALGRHADAKAAARDWLRRAAGDPSDTLLPTQGDLDALRARARALADAG